MKDLINTASLTKHIKDKGQVNASAIFYENVGGHVLEVNIGNETLILSTWRSNRPRLFKRADALLGEAKKMGLLNVNFEL